MQALLTQRRLVGLEASLSLSRAPDFPPAEKRCVFLAAANAGADGEDDADPEERFDIEREGAQRVVGAMRANGHGEGSEGGQGVCRMPIGGRAAMAYCSQACDEGRDDVRRRRRG